MFVLVVSNPFYSFASLVCALLYNGVINPKRIKKNILFVLCIIIFVSLFNMLFAHWGADVLFKIGYTKFTLEALFYGFNQGMVFSAVVMWFSALSYNSDGDRVLYLFSFAPKLSLMFSMILGFIPRFNKKLTEIRDAQKALRGGESPKGVKNKFKTAVSNLSALITYSLESSIITADSMNARGYKKGAMSVKRYKFCAQDFLFITIILAAAVLLIFSKATGRISFVFDPFIYSESFSTAAFIVFCIAELIPFIAEMWEEMLWKLSNSRT